MPRNSLPPEYMTVKQLAEKMGIDPLRISTDLKLEIERPFPKYPFVTVIKDEKTGAVQCRISRRKYELWERGELNDPAQLIAAAVEILTPAIITALEQSGYIKKIN